MELLKHLYNCRFCWYYRLTLCLLVYFFTNSYYVSGQITYWDSIGAFISGSILVNIIYALITLVIVYPLHTLYWKAMCRLFEQEKRPTKHRGCDSCWFLTLSTFVIMLGNAVYKFNIGDALLWEAVLGGILGAILMNWIILILGFITVWPIHSFFSLVWRKCVQRNVVQTTMS